MASTEKPIGHQNQQQQQQQRQQQVLKCPRCNSLNTKFCYYNNYSLSQPRHFCKACKRYWTNGGTLRNVPIGGCCRKNKRIKTTFTTLDDTPKPNPNSNPNLHHSTPSNNLNSLYGLLQGNPKNPRLINTSDVISKYDLVQSQNSLGLRFSSSDPHDPLVANTHTSVSLVANYPSIFSGGFNSSCISDHTMSSVLASSFHQQPTFLKFEPYGDEGGSVVNEVHMDWNNSLNGQIDNEQITGLELTDPTSFVWNITGGDGIEWHDPTSNISVPSLI